MAYNDCRVDKGTFSLDTWHTLDVTEVEIAPSRLRFLMELYNKVFFPTV